MAEVVNFPLLIQALNNDIETIEHNRAKKTLRDNSDPLDLPEGIFKNILRFSKATAGYLIDEISPFLPDAERDTVAIPKHLMVLCALHFYSQGSYQKGVGQDLNCPMSQSSVSRCINLVTDVLIEHFNDRIQFPVTQEQKDAEKLKFVNELNGFPGIIGAVDGTHVKIQAPPADDEEFPGILFYNRKGYYSLNTQIICGADLRILAVNPRYPGSVHDSAIWATSAIRGHLLENYNNGDRSSWVIRDSGYPLEPWLMNPILTADMDEHKRAYNVVLRRVRNVVERVIGLLKSRFRCCFSHRTLHYSPIKAAKIIEACCILHNIFLEQQDLFLEDEEGFGNEEAVGVNNEHGDDQNWLNIGTIIRNRIVAHYF